MRESASDEGSFVLPFFIASESGPEIAATHLAMPERRSRFMHAV
jgi:hypothetical protein